MVQCVETVSCIRLYDHVFHKGCNIFATNRNITTVHLVLKHHWYHEWVLHVKGIYSQHHRQVSIVLSTPRLPLRYYLQEGITITP